MPLPCNPPAPPLISSRMPSEPSSPAPPNPQTAIACAIQDALEYANDGRPNFALIVLGQVELLAQQQFALGQPWAAEALHRVRNTASSERAETHR